ncbi:MAG: hypothetical protein ACR2IF_10985 [Terriglobales bacterium]
MGTPAYRDPEPRPKLVLVPPTAQSRRRWRPFIIAAIILAVVVIIGVAVFLAGISGKAPAKPPAPKPSPTGMMIPASWFG